MEFIQVLKDVYSNRNEEFKLTDKQITILEELKAKQQDPVKCYREDDRSIKCNTANYHEHTVWKYFSMFHKEVMGNYIVATMHPEDVLYDQRFCCFPEKYPDLIIKPGKYDVVEMEKDLSKEAHLALYDDGENRGIPEDVVNEIKKLKAVPNSNTICRCLKEDCVYEDGKILVYKYSYCIYDSPKDEQMFDEDLYYIIEVKPSNIVFSSDHCDSFKVKLCCDLIITPGVYNIVSEENPPSLEDEGDEGDEGDDKEDDGDDYVEAMVQNLSTDISILDEDLTDIKYRLNNLTKYTQEIDNLTRKLDECSTTLLAVSNNLTSLMKFLRDKE